MLSRLRVKNIALVENISIDLHPGLNIITGETGAGKSILIGALSLLLGERADKSIIRTGEDACGAEALFSLADTAEIDAVLEQAGAPVCEEGQLVIRRIVRAAGSGQTMVNDSPVTLSVLRQLGDLLVDMHGPHEHQSLLSPAVQLEILDAFGRCWTERAAYEGLYREIQDAEARKWDLAMDEEEMSERIDRLTYTIGELDQATLDEAEEANVEEEHALAGNAQRITELASGVAQALTEGEGCAFDALAAAQNALRDLEKLLPDAVSWREEAAAAAAQVQELSAAISSRIEAIEINPSRMEWLDQRLTVYQQLKRKYGMDVGELMNKLEDSRERLRDLQTRHERIRAIDGELETLRERLRSAGETLRAKRVGAAGRLAKAVTAQLRGLGFSHGAFDVAMEAVDPRPSGLDDVEFGFAPNVGESMRPLRAIASSGEISRVMLATKAVLAGHDRIPLMIFDEIDANVGGEMGHAVGAKLAEVAANHQVICITHLPQVAACGDHHYAVEKYVSGNRTYSRVRELSGDHRVEELKRMLGGDGRAESARRHAGELLKARPH
jgi:DNA repair protein RecN (Recombination protein N)